MGIPEAIYVSEKNLTWAEAAMPPDCFKAYKLGIEALERVLSKRAGPYIVKKYLLPSETKD